MPVLFEAEELEGVGIGILLGMTIVSPVTLVSPSEATALFERLTARLMLHLMLP